MNSDAHRNSLTPTQRALQKILIRIRPAPVASFIKKMLGLDRVVVTTANGQFWVDPISNLGVCLCEDGVYEADMQKTLETYLSAGSTFVDLGANEGYFSVLAAKLCGPSGQVVVIEPQERLLPVIAENFRLNGIENPGVRNVAVSDAPGTATIHLSPDVNTGTSGLSNNSKYKVSTQQVATTTLEQLLDGENTTRVDLMKVDIEGFEYEALLGSPQVFAQHRVRALALELHPSILAARGKDATGITKMLEANGYTLHETADTAVWHAPA